jgi:hypothetical protein
METRQITVVDSYECTSTHEEIKQQIIDRFDCANSNVSFVIYNVSTKRYFGIIIENTVINIFPVAIIMTPSNVENISFNYFEFTRPFILTDYGITITQRKINYDLIVDLLKYDSDIIDFKFAHVFK